MRLTRRWFEDVLEMADKEERESEQIRKERECELSLIHISEPTRPY